MTRRELDRTALTLGAQVCLVLTVCTACAPSPVIAPSAEPTMVQTQQNEVEQLGLSQRKLGDLLRELYTTLPPDSARQLHDTQARWETLAHDECSWQRDLSGGGSMSSLVYATCLDRRLRERIDWLKLFLCEGYGSTGECQASKQY
ncbi:lysozyme inhibitor LprI family protein [Trinickia violacea]|nr:lysozyme inhibitor LprI family protein [Trinickia violacea]